MNHSWGEGFLNVSVFKNSNNNKFYRFFAFSPKEMKGMI